MHVHAKKKKRKKLPGAEEKCVFMFTMPVTSWIIHTTSNILHVNLSDISTSANVNISSEVTGKIC